MKIAVVSGTRADWGLLRPLAEELKKRSHEVIVYATNMHSNPEFGDTVDELIADGFPPSGRVAYAPTPAETVAANASGIAKLLRRDHPDCMVVLGDRTEILGAASAALVEGVPIVHIAGGTVSEGAIDDTIRHAVSKMASLHLVETELCKKRLLAMGEMEERVIVAGATGVWNALHKNLMTPRQLTEKYGFGFENGRILIVTLHAATRSPISPRESMAAMLTAISEALEEYSDLKILMTWPNNDVDPEPQVRLMEELASRYPERVKVVKSLGALGYLSAVKVSSGVVGNSSSGIVETPSLGVPTLNIGTRQQGRERGRAVTDCRDDSTSILDGLRYILSEEAQHQARISSNPYFHEDTPRVMADAIEATDFAPYPVKHLLLPPEEPADDKDYKKKIEEKMTATAKRDETTPSAANDSLRTLYLIPARGGSKGIPGKNIKPFRGKPLIWLSIENARACGASDADICVSTDSEEIKQTAERAGLEVPFLRPAELATDRSGTYEVILHALEFYRRRGVEYDRVVLLQPTSPLRQADDIKGAIAQWRPDLDMVVSVCEAKTNPYYNAFERDSEGFLHISKGEGKLTRRQDAPEVVEYNGAVYVMTTASLMRGPLSSFSRRVGYLMESSRSVDLDTPTDWLLAEAAAERAELESTANSKSTVSASKSE